MNPLVVAICVMLALAPAFWGMGLFVLMGWLLQ